MDIKLEKFIKSAFSIKRLNFHGLRLSKHILAIIW